MMFDLSTPIPGPEERNHRVSKDAQYEESEEICHVKNECDTPHFKQFGWCYYKPQCLLNFPEYIQCRKKQRKKCSLEKMCWSCHNCFTCSQEDDSSDEEFICECENCEKEKFPCQQLKFPCNCKICKKIPDAAEIPKELYIFQRIELDYGHDIEPPYDSWVCPGLTSKFDPEHLRKSIYSASAVATHFAQERFSEEHLKNIEKNVKVEKLKPRTEPPNLCENLHAWKLHKEITKSVHEFRKKYHRFPPCFRERMDMRSITKVSLLSCHLILFCRFFHVKTKHFFRP
jgi:hypothetical protein